ncbi:hypothetical protein K458DRAFT_404983 [Lentithecium fluviatile CBS 122367]|uniref:Uncharacterized protein n=1 Tax=Lentithecium fluviatile CBS 122367 TaxID=1168545 RepID=A0A6G1IZQ0_9PLEO|nr:hypothetical protein K458DRAFT_404983 [Lentithecium fluviatile CBS 122367]
MYRRGDPRWNRTIQNITDTVEHANESAQEGLYSFTHQYVSPCFQSVTQCVNACTAPCFPSQNDRRRHRARSRGGAESSFDFYDDWEEDENDGLLGWGNDNLDRLWGSPSNYGAVTQPGRQNTMSYGNRTRDPKYNKTRRKSAVQPHDGGPDPTIIPSSSYFGFLGRLPFKIGGKVLRYKPSAADLTEHPGLSRRSYEEAVVESQPLMEDSDEEAGTRNERKGHGRKRSQTDASGHTTDSLSSRGDIFPSDDEDDAVPLDDEFALALERRTTGQWHDDTSSGKSKPRSSSRGKSKRPSGSRVSTRSTSTRNTQDSGRKSMERTRSDIIEEIPTLSDLKQEEERVRIEEEAEVERKRYDAQQLALKRGLAPNHGLQVPGRAASQSPHRNPGSPRSPSPRGSVHPMPSPLLQSTSSEPDRESDTLSSPFPTVDSQTMPDSSSFHVDESDYSSLAPTPNRPLSLNNEPRELPVQPEL